MATNLTRHKCLRLSGYAVANPTYTQYAPTSHRHNVIVQER